MAAAQSCRYARARPRRACPRAGSIRRNLVAALKSINARRRHMVEPNCWLQIHRTTWFLLRLRRDPPAGVTFSGWDATPIDFDEGSRDVHMLSHPDAGVMKYTAARAFADDQVSIPGQSERTNVIAARITEGAAEAGSSGAGAFEGKYFNWHLSQCRQC